MGVGIAMPMPKNMICINGRCIQPCQILVLCSAQEIPLKSASGWSLQTSRTLAKAQDTHQFSPAGLALVPGRLQVSFLLHIFFLVEGESEFSSSSERLCNQVSPIWFRLKFCH